MVNYAVFIDILFQRKEKIKKSYSVIERVSVVYARHCMYKYFAIYLYNNFIETVIIYALVVVIRYAFEKLNS